jgi:uncharacterized protein (DUF433 family)
MKVDIERNAEIAMMRKNGATLKEIAEWYEVSQPRIVQICENFSDGDTKEEIIRNYKRKQEERKAREMERRLECQRLEDQRKGGKEYVILNGAEELYLTAIEQADGQTVYRYKSADIHDALWFTLEDARRIARKRKARAIWVPAVRW